MARPRKTPMQAAAAAVAAAAAAEQELGLPDDDAEEAEISADVLEGLRRLDQGGNRVTWYVYSDSPGKKGDSEGYVEKLRTEHLDEQRFKQRYGAGEYRVLGRTSDGHYVKGSHTVIRISDIGMEAPAAPSAGGDAATLLREMRAADEARQKSRDENLKTYATILATPLATLAAAFLTRKPAIDIAALITALRPAQSPPTLVEMTTALASLKSLQPEGGGGGGNVELVLKVLERLQDLPQGSAGEGGWIGFMRDMVKEALPAAREFLGRSQGAPALPPGAPMFAPGANPVLPRPVLPAGPNPAVNGASPPTPTASAASPPSSLPSDVPPSDSNSAQGAEMWALAEPWLRRRAEDLHEWAAANMEVELCAEVLLASVPKIFRAMLSEADLCGFLQRPDWWAVLTGFHPPLSPYHAWIDDVRQELLGLLMEHPNPDSGASSAPDDEATRQ